MALSGGILSKAGRNKSGWKGRKQRVRDEEGVLGRSAQHPPFSSASYIPRFLLCPMLSHHRQVLICYYYISRLPHYHQVLFPIALLCYEDKFSVLRPRSLWVKVWRGKKKVKLLFFFPLFSLHQTKITSGSASCLWPQFLFLDKRSRTQPSPARARVRADTMSVHGLHDGPTNQLNFGNFGRKLCLVIGGRKWGTGNEVGNNRDERMRQKTGEKGQDRNIGDNAWR